MKRIIFLQEDKIIQIVPILITLLIMLCISLYHIGNGKINYLYLYFVFVYPLSASETFACVSIDFVSLLPSILGNRLLLKSIHINLCSLISLL